MPEDVARRVLAEARASTRFAPRCEVPTWYLHRWHFLPEGYLSRRSVRAYDAVIRRIYHAGMEGRTHALIHRVLRATRPSAIVELGCGPGRLMASMARRFPGAHLTGIDLSPYMLDMAAQRLEGVTDARLVHGDASQLEWPQSGVDSIVASHVLGHVPRDVGNAIAARAVAALRPGGRFLLIDHPWHPLPDPIAALPRSRHWIVPALVCLTVATLPR